MTSMKDIQLPSIQKHNFTYTIYLILLLVLALQIWDFIISLLNLKKWRWQAQFSKLRIKMFGPLLEWLNQSLLCTGFLTWEFPYANMQIGTDKVGLVCAYAWESISIKSSSLYNKSCFVWRHNFSIVLLENCKCKIHAGPLCIDMDLTTRIWTLQSIFFQRIFKCWIIRK